MFKTTLFAAKTIAVAVLGVAVAGCESDMMGDNGQAESTNNQVQARLAAQSEERPVLNLGEAGPTEVIAISQPATETVQWLTVKSSGFDKNDTIPTPLAAGGNSAGPKLSWSAVPAQTESFAVIVEDPDSAPARPFVHLIAFNIPTDQTQFQLSETSASRMSQNGTMLGKNSRNEMNYIAPQPISGELHHYHFQVFALDGKLPLPAGANKKELLDAMNGHVLAKGEIVGTYQGK